MSKTVKDPLIIELPYLPPIAWFEVVKQHDIVFLDRHEHYEKATYRNRCHILGPNGLLRLSIPLVRGKNQHTPSGQVRISYEQPWQKNHWMTLGSCYRRSPYFEYYEDVFHPFYHNRYDTLFEYNFELLKLVMKILNMQQEILFTDKYIGKSEAGYEDMRSIFLPNTPVPANIQLNSYTQVFSDRFEFIPNLSIIDHIFNNGNKF